MPDNSCRAFSTQIGPHGWAVNLQEKLASSSGWWRQP